MIPFKNIVTTATCIIEVEGRGNVMALHQFGVLKENKEDVFPTMPSRRGLPRTRYTELGANSNVVPENKSPELSALRERFYVSGW